MNFYDQKFSGEINQFCSKSILTYVADVKKVNKK